MKRLQSRPMRRNAKPIVAADRLGPSTQAIDAAHDLPPLTLLSDGAHPPCRRSTP
jgi:hypothetical protein